MNILRLRSTSFSQIKAFKPQSVSIKNEPLVGELKEALACSDYMPEKFPSDEGVIEVSSPLS